MGTATDQSDNIIPPRQNQILPLNVNSTALTYDLTAVSLQSPYVNGQARQFVYVTLSNRGSADVYFYFSNTNSTALNDANAVALNATLAYNNSYGVKLAAGSERSYRIDKNVDKFLCLKTNASTAVVDVFASSQASVSGG